MLEKVLENYKGRRLQKAAPRSRVQEALRYVYVRAELEIWRLFGSNKHSVENGGAVILGLLLR